jgi:hypothetical protein
MNPLPVQWDMTVGQVDDQPGRWVCVLEGAEELAGYGADADDAEADMHDHYLTATVH